MEHCGSVLSEIGPLASRAQRAAADFARASASAAASRLRCWASSARAAACSSAIAAINFRESMLVLLARNYPTPARLPLAGLAF
jgi:hypothetical protein